MARLRHQVKNYLGQLRRAAISIRLQIVDSLLFLTAARRNDSDRIRVLVIRLDRIGDFILWVNSARDLRRLYPRSTHTITLLANDLWAPLARHLDVFDEIWQISRRKFAGNTLYRATQMHAVRQGRFDLAIQPTYSREFDFGDAVIRLCGARERIGSSGDISNITAHKKQRSDRWYTRLVAASGEALMELVRNAEFMRGLGLSDARAAVPQLPSAPLIRPAWNGDYIVLFPGASEPIKQWPTGNFIRLARVLHDRTSMQIVLCGGSDDVSLGRELEAGSDFPVINRVGRTSLNELAGIIAGARLLVGNDTSAIHIAAAVATPAVCIAGGGHFGRFVPYEVETGHCDAGPVIVTSRKECFGCNWKCVYPLPRYAAAPCIGEVTVEDVWEALRPLVPANCMSAGEETTA